uniref:Clp protease ATP binding subunit n=1 Tax=Babesia rodhaini TaxID=5870 RepID=A0A455R069_BABRO|nr:Clp protease ATP binding subunit [Babesia rodhaini]
MNNFFNNIIDYKKFLDIYIINKKIIKNYKINYFLIFNNILKNNNKKKYYFKILDIIKFINLFYNKDIWIIKSYYNNIYKYIKKLIISINKEIILINININNIKNIDKFNYNNKYNKKIIIIINYFNFNNNYIEDIKKLFYNKLLKNIKIIFIFYNNDNYKFILKKLINSDINKINIIKSINYNIKDKKINNNYNNIILNNNIILLNNIDLCNRLLNINLYGQNNIVSIIKKNIKESFDYYKVNNKKPLNSFLLCGPSGTGKTEIAKILSKSIYGDLGNLLKFDMSEFIESHSISKLIGTPPGYIGYNEGGRLINLINENKNSIVLFDEIEKANKNIYNIMLQMLDEGILTSSTGEKGIFKNSFIIFTSNIGQNESYNINNDKLYIKNILKAVNNYFSNEFLSRINNILIFKYQNFNYLIKTLNKFKLEFEHKYNTNFIFSDIIKKIIYNLLSNKIYGARVLNKQSYKFISNSIDILNYVNILNNFIINNNINLFNIYLYNKNININKGYFLKNIINLI